MRVSCREVAAVPPSYSSSSFKPPKSRHQHRLSRNRGRPHATEVRKDNLLKRNQESESPCASESVELLLRHRLSVVFVQHQTHLAIPFVCLCFRTTHPDLIYIFETIFPLSVAFAQRHTEARDHLVQGKWPLIISTHRD